MNNEPTLSIPYTIRIARKNRQNFYPGDSYVWLCDCTLICPWKYLDASGWLASFQYQMLLITPQWTSWIFSFWLFPHQTINSVIEIKLIYIIIFFSYRDNDDFTWQPTISLGFVFNTNIDCMFFAHHSTTSLPLLFASLLNFSTSALYSSW